MNSVIPNNFTVIEDFLVQPEIFISIYISGIQKFQRTYIVDDGWLKILKGHLEDFNIYGNYKDYIITVTLNNYIFNKTITVKYKGHDADLGFMHVDTSIRRLLTYVKKKEQNGV